MNPSVAGRTLPKNLFVQVYFKATFPLFGETAILLSLLWLYLHDLAVVAFWDIWPELLAMLLGLAITTNQILETSKKVWLLRYGIATIGKRGYRHKIGKWNFAQKILHDYMALYRFHFQFDVDGHMYHTGLFSGRDQFSENAMVLVLYDAHRPNRAWTPRVALPALSQKIQTEEGFAFALD
ncbi:MAG TPA: hypothetical protein DCE41_34655 [Cytophagales bacterium]|nr:hypothetical protein [Cytophagales bacterium]HAA21890.1 hypothetical protein [Cytophagales bacterium]HAP60173.1 hypothetical protein [Cytophagales bacterium]